MAPWPAQGNEPKAPDRNKTSDNRTLDTLKSKSEPPEDKKLIKGISKEDQSEARKKDVHSLDDGQLKALLDEAIQYKNPKDREGKSKIFRELLQKVEADDSDCSYPVVGIRGSSGRRALRIREGNKSIAISERATRSGSLQNIFHAASSAEFDTHHSGGARKKSKRQGPGSSVSARQREGGSLPSNVNTGWPLESWQSDQLKKKGLFDRDSVQPNHVSASFGNTAYCNSSSVAIASTQARRQTLKHSASNELPSSKKTSPGELYPLRRHHSSSDQLRSFELNIVKLKNQPESSSMVRKMPQLPKPTECVPFDMSSLNLEIKKLSDSDPSLSFEKKLQGFQNSDKCRITSCDTESENPSNNSQEVFTTRASLEVESVDSSIELGFSEKRVLNGMESVQLSDNYSSVQSIVGDRIRIPDTSNQGRVGEQPFTLRPHMYRNLNMAMNGNTLVNSSSKTPNESPRTDENGNALNAPSLTSRGSNSKNQKRKIQAQKNVILSHDIAGYLGDKDINEVLDFIESGKGKNKQFKKLTKGKKNEKKRQNMQKSSSFDDVSQRNIEDLSESSESEKTNAVQKLRIGNSTDPSLRDLRKYAEQVFVKSGSHNDLNADEAEENNSDSEFQMVTKKQRKRKINDPNPKRVRNHRNSRRSPRRKSTSSVPPSERSGDSDLDSVHSLPVGGAPTVSYADIAAGNSAFFTPKAINEISTFNGKNNAEKVESASAVKANEIEKWCNSVNQHWEKSSVNNNSNNNCSNNNSNNHINNNNNNINNNNNSNNNSNSNNHNININNNISNINNKNKINTNNPNYNSANVNGHKNNNTINVNNNFQNTSNSVNVNHTNINNINNNNGLKNCSRHDNRKQNLGVEVNEICDNNVKKLKDLVIVDKSVDKKVVTTNKVVELPLKTDLKKNASSCDLDSCKGGVDVKGNESKRNYNKKKFSREDFPSLPVKSENSNHPKNKENSEQVAVGKIKQYSSLPPDTENQDQEDKGDRSQVNKTLKKSKAEDEGKHRRSTRSKSVGPNTRPPVILLHDERTKDTSVCEITFGFEVNVQLLTSDESANVFKDGAEEDDVSSYGSKSSRKSNNNTNNNDNDPRNKSINRSSSPNVNGNAVYNDAKENQNAYLNSSKGALGEVTHATAKEYFDKQETSPMPKTVSSVNQSSGDNSANTIANKYVPPAAPVQFNFDKIVSFVGLAWEDVMRNGKIQYYTGDN